MQNSYIGRVYDSKCGCKMCVVDTAVEVNEKALGASNGVFLLHILKFCGKQHIHEITPNVVKMTISDFESALNSTYSTDLIIDSAMTLLYRGKIKQYEKDNKGVDKYNWINYNE